MSKMGINITSSTVPVKNSTIFSAEIEHEYKLAAEAIEIRVLRAIADKFVEEYGDEIIGMIDMDRLGKQINGKVLGAALKQLSQEENI